MRFQGAIVKEQGITFAIVVVKPHVVQNSAEANQTIQQFQPAFPRMPVVLAAQDSRGNFTYFGREDISRFLSSISPARIPWQEYTLG
ncbi:MAG: hypothetical protein EOO61_22670 [Hymenobacter sp.]|nr:MAG: hypothetical protein EOO61_22670 [Hymenobacter sp.]